MSQTDAVWQKEGLVTRQGNEPVVEGGGKRFRPEKERKIREDLFRRHRGDPENSGAVERLPSRVKLLLEARRRTRRLSGRGW